MTKAPGFQKHPNHRVDLAREGKRVRVLWNGVILADSSGSVTVSETGYVPVHYFPREDVRMDLLTPTDHHSTCPFKGEASYRSVAADGKQAENAVWSYEQPYEEVEDIRDKLAFWLARLPGATVEIA